MLKLIGSRARADLEKLLERKVMLKTFVKSKETWQDNEQILQSVAAFYSASIIHNGKP